jgi:aminoglycoside phosphotransferase (APT) family kinase protein
LSGKLANAHDLNLSELRGPALTGFSNETILFDATWQADGVDHSRSLVVRVKPTLHTVFLDSNFESQYRVIKTLSERTDVPMPTVYWYEEDAAVLGSPFFVMGKVEGSVPGDSPPYSTEGWLFEATPEQQSRLWWDHIEVMSRIHNLDWRGLGLGFLDRQDRGPTGLDQQLAYNQEYFEWAARGRSQPTLEAAWDWLVAHRPAPSAPETDCLCWGDSRIGNMIFEDFGVQAVLDWEMVTIGDPVRDLGWSLFLDRFFSDAEGLPRLPGFPSWDATVARWEELTGRSADDLLWYEVFAGYQFGIVMCRIAQLMARLEMVPAELDYERNNLVTQLLEKVLAEV